MISTDELKGVARWIHAKLPEPGLRALLAGFEEAIASPLAAEISSVSEDSNKSARLAAAYFLRLPGRVATLGGAGSG